MARSSNQKLKLLYIRDFLLRHSDEAHPVTVNQIISHLQGKDISAERKSIYSDLEALRCYGMDIIQTDSGRTSSYYAANRDFELAELKLLVDSVQSSKFITLKKTNALIKKLETLASSHDARLLNRQVYVSNRIKTMNESIYYNVDEIHNGISQNRKIRFKYFDYDVAKQQRFRRGGADYTVSPFAMTWDNENYYMVAFDSQAQLIKHYRVDKMTRITMTDEERDGQEAYRSIDMGVYTRKVFGMFSGDEERVSLRFEKDLVSPVLDRLGHEAFIVPDGDTHFTVSVDVVVSPQFFAWLCGFGTRVQILSPAHVAAAMRRHMEEIAALYAGTADKAPN